MDGRSLVEGSLEEYRALRDEIVKRQDARRIALGIETAAVGPVFAAVSSSTNGIAQDGALVCFLLGLVLASTCVITQDTRQIDRIAAYVRLTIEPVVPGIQWETTWRKVRLSAASPLGGRLPLGASKMYAVFQLAVTVGVVALAETTEIAWILKTVVVPVLGLLAAFSSVDLYFRILPAWNLNLDLLEAVSNADSAESDGEVETSAGCET